VSKIQTELRLDASEPSRGPRRLLEFLTVIYRTSLYVFLQRILYDGHMKMYGSRLNPIGCAVVYFAYAQPQMGDNLTNSEDIFIGHFFTWKGWRNIQVTGVRCESIEPSIERLPRQLYLWSSSFLQALYYFRELPLSPFKEASGLFFRPRAALHGRPLKHPPVAEQEICDRGQSDRHQVGGNWRNTEPSGEDAHPNQV
jgi:hypothetical protein